jgi:hypothetical protein
MSEGDEAGGQPTKLGECAECGQTYPIHRTDEGWHPVGTDGTCACGNDEIVPFDSEE